MSNQKMKISLSLSGVVMILALFITHSYISIAALLGALIHEAAHILMAKLCKIDLRELKLGIFGAALTTSDISLSYKKEILIALAGPTANLLSAAILIPFLSQPSGEAREFLELFVTASIFLGALNLLPIKDFDGGRALFCLISYFGSPKAAERTVTVSSVILIFSLWALSSYLLLKLASSLSLFIFSLSLFCKFFSLGKKSFVK